MVKERGLSCELRFTLQGRYPSVIDLRAFRVTNTAVTIHGSALLAGNDITEADFIKAEEKSISRAFRSYLERNALLPGRHHLIILDMEPSYPDPSDPDRSISFSPGNIGRYEDNQSLQAELIQAYVTRIIVAREILREKWPTVRLALYGVVVPDGRGEEDAIFEQRMRGYRRAGELGMYEFIDYLLPVLYNRFGLSDVLLPDGDFDIDRLHRWIGRATHQAITNSQRLTRRNRRPIPLAPVLTFWVVNGNSAHHHKVVSPDTMSFQLGILQKYRSVDIIVFWSGPETSDEMRQAGYEPLEFNDFMAQVEALPPPGCR
jgi:hypothetical protein